MSSEQDVFQATLEKLQEQEATSDAEKVNRLFEQYRARGLAVVGVQDTLEALANGQADEVLISSALERIHPKEEPIDAVIAPEIPDSEGNTTSDEPRQVSLPDLFVTKATQTNAKLSFIEDASLLEAVDGVGAFLRWRT